MWLENNCKFDNLRSTDFSMLKWISKELLNLFGDDLSYIHIIGSLPRGNYLPSISDVDICIFTESKFEHMYDYYASYIEHSFKNNFNNYYGEIDLPIISQSTNFNLKEKYQFLIKTDGLMLFSKDRNLIQSNGLLTTQKEILETLSIKELPSKFNQFISTLETISNAGLALRRKIFKTILREVAIIHLSRHNVFLRSVTDLAIILPTALSVRANIGNSFSEWVTNPEMIDIDLCRYLQSNVIEEYFLESVNSILTEKS